MKTFTLFFISLMLGVSAISQNFFYSDNRKICFEKAEHWKTVQVREGAINKFRNETLDRFELKERMHLLPDNDSNFFWVEKRNGSKIEVSNLKRETNIVRAFPAYYSINHFGDTIHFIMYDVFHVRFSDGVSKEDVKKMNEQYFVEIISTGFDNEYLLRLTEKSSLTTLEVANIYYEDDLTIWSLPDFFTKAKDQTIEDTYFENQWHLHNTGQGGGVAGVDINVVPAWDITTGSHDIIVAVAENLAVSQHEDFYEGQIVTGYHARNQNNNLTIFGNHAVCVGGIIIANHNDKGVRGVAPKSKIMPIFLSGASSSRVANAIDTAWHRGADIINFSWGYDKKNTWYDNIAQAIQRAMNNGRNGKGAVVVACAGNFDSYVIFPGSVPGVLTVGAVSNHNQPLCYTPRSDLVDIIAPSGYRYDPDNLDIVTTDRHEPYGHEPYGYDHDYEYFFNFDGTSAASPQASGVAALMLSIDPNLTASQVKNIIKQSATSYGQTNWAGYGRLNAYHALIEVLGFEPVIYGPSEVTERSFYHVENMPMEPGGPSVSWSWSPSQAFSPCLPSLYHLCVEPNQNTTNATVTATISHSDWGQDIVISKSGIAVKSEVIDPGDPIVIPPGIQGPYVEDSQGGWSETHCLSPYQLAYMVAVTRPGQNIDTYHWELKYDNYQELLGNEQVSDIFTINDPGVTYHIELKAYISGEGWSGKNTKELEFCQNLLSGYTYNIYPNPATSILFCDITTDNQNNHSDNYPGNVLLKVRLYNWDSELILTDSFYLSELPYGIDVSTFRRGKYIIHILYDDYLLHSRQVVLK